MRISFVSILRQLKRRNVLRMGALYLGAAWLVMQVLDVLEGPLSLPAWIGFTVLAVLAVGFPIALILSWFYEVTPEGITRDDDVGPDTSAAVSGRRVDFIIIAVMAAALLLFAYDKWWTEPPPERSVAILPFVAMSSGEDDGYFADGLTEEILNALAQLPELRVTARTSSFFFKGKDIPVPEVARLLNVAHVVEGSVRRDGERLRITSQLIRAADGFHMWSQTYDRTSEDIFTVQQDIAEKVAETLEVVLDDEALRRMRAIQINNVEAFIAYQKGLDAYASAHTEGQMIEKLVIANEYFDKALAAQPTLYAARVLRADLAGHRRGVLINSETSDASEVQQQVDEWRTELELAWRATPNGNQRDILDVERTMASDDWTGLSLLITKAMQPGNCSRINLSEMVALLGFAEELAGKLEESLACDPLDADVIRRLGLSYIEADRPDEALELVDRAEAAGVDSGSFDGVRRRALFVAGRLEDPLIQRFLNSTEYLYPTLIRNLINGDQQEAQKIAERIWNSPDVATNFALRVAALVGDRAYANELAARIDRYPSSAITLLGTIGTCLISGRAGLAKGCRHGVPFDLEATPNFKTRIEESGLPWPPVAFRDIQGEAL